MSSEEMHVVGGSWAVPWFPWGSVSSPPDSTEGQAECAHRPPAPLPTVCQHSRCKHACLLARTLLFTICCPQTDLSGKPNPKAVLGRTLQIRCPNSVRLQVHDAPHGRRRHHGQSPRAGGVPALRAPASARRPRCSATLSGTLSGVRELPVRRGGRQASATGNSVKASPPEAPWPPPELVHFVRGCAEFVN